MEQLELYRRHTKECEEEAEKSGEARGRAYKRCHCPVWCDGYRNGTRVRHSLQTASWDRAERRLARELDPDASPPSKAIPDAIAIYLDDCRSRQFATSTVVSYTKTLDRFAAFCAHEKYLTMKDLTLEALVEFRASRRGRTLEDPQAASTQRKKIETLRSFFAFGVEIEWLKTNGAKKLRKPAEDDPPTLPSHRKRSTVSSRPAIGSGIASIRPWTSPAGGRGHWSCCCCTPACAYQMRSDLRRPSSTRGRRDCFCGR